MTYPPQGPPPRNPYPPQGPAPREGGYPRPAPVAPPPTVRPLNAPPTAAGPPLPSGRPLPPGPPPHPYAPFGSRSLPPRPVMPPPAVAYRPAPPPGMSGAAPQPGAPGLPSPQWTQPGYRGGYQPPRKSHAGAIVGLSLGAVAVLMLGLIGVAASSVRHSSRRIEAGYTTTYPTYETNAAPTASYTVDPTTSGSRYLTRTTDPATTRRTSTSTPTTPSGPKKVELLATNPLFGSVSTTSVTCNLSRYQHNPAGQQKLLNEAVTCLDAMWRPMLTSAGLPFATPKLAFPAGRNWSSPCGSVSNGDAAAFYCSQDGTLYMPWTGLQSDEYGAHPGIYLAVLAHEYGHHVQDLSGISDAYQTQAYNTGSYDTPQALELSRRLELEAQCFSGTFFAAAEGRGAFDQNIVGEGEQTEQRGDGQRARRDHGTNAHAQGWWDQGLRKHTTQQCDTWASNAVDVA